MPEKEPQFTITDRRKFTAEGELRENDQKATESTPSPVAVQREPEPPEATEEGELIPEPTAAESAHCADDGFSAPDCPDDRAGRH